MDNGELTQIVEIVQKDKGQFELLYSQIVKKVYYWCFTVIRNKTDAFDASQEAMLRIYQNINTLDNPEKFIPWMYRIVRNVCLNYLKQQSKYDSEFLYNDNSEQDFEASIKEERRENLPEEAYELKETKELIIKFISKLPKRQREVITLFYLEEMKIDEIAYILDYNAGSVKSRLHSGRKNLEIQIKEYQEEHGVKLYGFTLLPMLGLILREHREEIFKNQNFKFDKQKYHTNNLSSISSIPIGMTSYITTIVSILLIITTLIIGTLYQNREINDSNDDLKILEKEKANSHIKSISHSSFPTRTKVDVFIELKKDLPSESIEIVFEQEQLLFTKNGKEIVVEAKENGEYFITINQKTIKVTIDNIDEFAPELVAIKNYGNHLKLDVSDELSQIDYSKSYVEYLDKRYGITDDLIVNGKFQGVIIIVLFDKDNRYIRYKDNTYY